MRRTSSLVVAALATLAACDRPKVLLICHNANCAEPVDPESDDTLPALRESLAIEVNGRPALDGIEVDSFWRGADAQCLFAHDLANAPMTLMAEVAPVIAEHFARPGNITASGEPFRVFIELKAHVGPETAERHTPEQRVLHAACAWQVYTALVDAARANNREIEVIFSSFEPKLLREVVNAEPSPLPMPYKLDAFYGIPRPLDSETRPLDEYKGLPIGIVEMHAQWIHDAQAEGILSQDVELMFWMFSATVETFAAIEQYEPKLVGTSEARLLRRWLER
jgi:hypothetical protein